MKSSPQNSKQVDHQYSGKGYPIFKKLAARNGIWIVGSKHFHHKQKKKDLVFEKITYTSSSWNCLIKYWWKSQQDSEDEGALSNFPHSHRTAPQPHTKSQKWSV